jgi:hypothetical protein
MRFYIFTCGLAILAAGAASTRLLDQSHAVGFLQGALTLGGGILICGLFSIKMQWHGIIGAGIMALLGSARGLGNVPSLMEFFAGNRPRGTAPLLEFGVTVISLLLLLKVIRALARERVRRMLESAE